MFLYRTRGVFWMVWLVWKWCESYAMAFNGRCNVFDSALHHHHQNIFGRWAFSSVADAQRAFRLISRWPNKRTQKGKLSTHLFSTAYHSLTDPSHLYHKTLWLVHFSFQTTKTAPMLIWIAPKKVTLFFLCISQATVMEHLNSYETFRLSRSALWVTHGPGVFQGVCSEHGFGSLGGASRSSLVNRTNPELVQSSFLQAKHRVVARFLNMHIAAHPLTLSDIISERERRKKKYIWIRGKQRNA